MLIGIDVGGTFTDVVSVANDEIRTIKVATDARLAERAVLQGSEEIGVAGARQFNHASTHGLNAIITRRLPKVAFLTTIGHRDILDMGRVWRPVEGQSDPGWRRPFGDAARPLVPRYLRRGIKERLTPDGEVLIPLDEQQALSEIDVLARCSVQGVAICLLNGYAHQEHEVRLRDLVRQRLGDIPISISSEVSPLAKEFTRASTTVVDTFMKLIYGNYSARLQSGLRQLGFKGEINYSNCAAQMLDADVAIRQPYQLVFAGPAGGTVASAHFGGAIGASNLLCADVGGTSCDISLVTDGQPTIQTTFELEHDLVVNAHSIAVESIGAGGGSLVRVGQAGEITVGPESAGSEPGPACYGRGGTDPATTDTLLMMGVLDPERFAGGRVSLDPQLARRAFESLDSGLTLAERVSYAFTIGVHNVAEGITNVAVKHGIDPREYSLVAFGAAGPMLLPATLGLVHCREVIVPPHPGLFSALGLVSADQVYADARSAYRLLEPDSASAIASAYEEMETALRARLGASADVALLRSFDGQYVGQTWETPFVDVPAGAITGEAVDQMVGAFHDAYEKRWGNRFENLQVRGVTYRVQAVVAGHKLTYPEAKTRATTELRPAGYRELSYLAEAPVTAAVYDREALCINDSFAGPAVVHEPLSTTFVLPGQHVSVGTYGELHITLAGEGDIDG